MNKNQIKEILKLNKDFYKDAASSFSATRQNPWKGWGRVLKFTGFPKKVLDVGCGNGRFYAFLQKNGDFKYTGVDFSNELIDEASKKYPSTVFINKDFLSEPVEGVYDLVTCFGVTHHIPDYGTRVRFFKNLSKNVVASGYLVLTFWEFDTDKSLRADWPEKGDYILGWDKKPGLKRYCHLYSDTEKADIVEVLKKCGMLRVESFRETDEPNHYFVFQKVDNIDV